jgi:hypothetical protein
MSSSLPILLCLKIGTLLTGAGGGKFKNHDNLVKGGNRTFFSLKKLIRHKLTSIL